MKLLVFSLVTATFTYVIQTSTTNCTSGQQCSSCEDSTDHCTSECFTGFYGPQCKLTCSQGCKDSVCIAHEGGIEECVHGCKAGFYGTRCNIPCIQAKGCQKCPQECEDGFCQVNSRCVSECEDSYYGTNCTSCGPDCEVCDRRTGTCLEDTSSKPIGPHVLYYLVGGAVGLLVIGFVFICICCQRRRSHDLGSIDSWWWSRELRGVKPRYYLPQYSEVKKDERGITLAAQQPRRRESYTDVYDAVST